MRAQTEAAGHRLSAGGMDDTPIEIMALPIHIAIASTTSRPGAVAENLLQIGEFARRASRDGAALLLTPELSACGYGNDEDVLQTAETAGAGPIYEALATCAAATNVVLCAGFIERCEERKYLAHYAVFPDRKFIVQRKHRVTRAEAPLSPAAPQLPPFESDGTGQPQTFSFEVFEVRGVRCAMVICADTGIAGLDEWLLQNGVQLLLLPTAAGGRREDRVTTAQLLTPEGRDTYFRVLQTVFLPGRAPLDCLQNRRALAAVNLCGYDGRRHYHAGHGSITNAMGEVVGFFHGLPNLDRQRPMYAHAVLDADDCLEPGREESTA